MRTTSELNKPLKVLPTDEAVQLSTVFARFDVHKARCAFPSDQDALLAIIESNFGSLRTFNGIMMREVNSAITAYSV